MAAAVGRATNTTGRATGRLRDMAKELAVVCGGGGLIGGHLTKYLLAGGKYRVRVVDVKPPHAWYQRFDAADNRGRDPRLREACDEPLRRATVGYKLGG